ncbi:hypothetical protein AURDEDRAFT_129212 [Auricularia subglabra TFB-10046 SS5]|nr:hypothetical protein AURDEDRAFT_129212 [Auricularia subglabra TFB-10046 SS5]
MRSASVIFFVIAAIASPATPPPPTTNVTSEISAERAADLYRTTYLANATLVACEAAPNCETYEDPIFGTRIRFVAGMEPGTEHYTRNVLSRRDSGTVTHVTLGDTALNYGSERASGVYGAIHRLYDICHEGSCDRSPYPVRSQYAYQTSAWWDNIILHASGQYNGWEERDGFVEALVAIAGQGESCWWENWGNGGGYYGGGESGRVYMCKQTNYIGFNRFSNGNLQGFMDVRAELNNAGGNWCATMLNALSGITGIIGAVPGLGAAGGASSFFGFLSVFCG